MTRPVAAPDLERLADVERQMSALEAERVRLMAEAQRQGASWEAIGAAIGTTKQSAWETYHVEVRRIHEAAADYVGTAEEALLDSAAVSLSSSRARRRRR